MKNGSRNGHRRQIRYAVVGLGHIAQVAVLPAFAHASRNSVLTALVSGDPVKRRELGKKYGIADTYSYDEYEQCLHSGEVDAVYLALPNHVHHAYTVRAARAGIHVLCEKPMAVTEEECRDMIQAAEKHAVKLMVAYRLHFEESNMKAAQAVQSGRIGHPRLFNSVFTMQVRPDDIRLDREKGGGTLYDIGIYCINAARYLFQCEPVLVSAFAARGRDRRFTEVDEMTAAIMRFPDERLGTFVCSFGAADVSAYQVVGTKGRLRVEPAYEYVGRLKLELTRNGDRQVHLFHARDQFAPELLYFSDCILKDRKPEPSGEEGLIDVKIIQALYRSAEEGRPMPIRAVKRGGRPTLRQAIRRPPVRKRSLVHTASPSL